MLTKRRTNRRHSVGQYGGLAVKRTKVTTPNSKLQLDEGAPVLLDKENCDPQKQRPRVKRRRSLGVMKPSTASPAVRHSSGKKKQSKKNKRDSLSKKRVSFGVVDIRLFQKNAQSSNTIDLGTIMELEGPDSALNASQSSVSSVSSTMSDGSDVFFSPIKLDTNSADKDSSANAKPSLYELISVSDVGESKNTASPILAIKTGLPSLESVLQSEEQQLDAAPQFDQTSDREAIEQINLSLDDVDTEEVTMEMTGNFSSIIQQEKQPVTTALALEEQVPAQAKFTNTDSKSYADEAISDSDDEPNVEEVTMEMTANFSEIMRAKQKEVSDQLDSSVASISDSFVAPDTEELTMEMTVNHSEIQNIFAQHKAETEAENAEFQEESVEETQDYEEEEEVSMEMTTNYSKITKINLNQDEVAATSGDTKEVTMEMTQNFSEIKQIYQENLEDSVVEGQENNEVSMDLTKNHSVIQNIQDLQEASEQDNFTNLSLDVLNNSQSDLEVSMEMTKNYSEITHIRKEDERETTEDFAPQEFTGEFVTQNKAPEEVEPADYQDDSEVSMDFTTNYSEIRKLQPQAEVEDLVDPQAEVEDTAEVENYNDSSFSEQEVNCDDVTMEMTHNFGEIKKDNKLDISLNSGEFNQRDTVDTDDMSMEFTKNHSEIKLFSESTNSEMNDSIDLVCDEELPEFEHEEPDVKEMSMDFTKNWGEVVSSTGEHIDSGDLTEELRNNSEDTSNLGENTRAIKHNVEDIVYGDSTEKTCELPQREKLSSLTAEMANIFEKILTGSDPDDITGLIDSNSSESNGDLDHRLSRPVEDSFDIVENEVTTPNANQMKSPITKPAINFQSISVADVLQMTGAKKLLDVSKKNHRDSEIGLENTLRDSDDRFEDDDDKVSDLAKILQNACVDAVEVDDYGQNCLQLVDITENIQSTVDQWTEYLDSNPPPIFARLMDSKQKLFTQPLVTKLVKQCQLEAKNTWNEWSWKVIEATYDRLSKHLRLLQEDVVEVRELKRVLQDLYEMEAKKVDPTLVSLRAGIEEQSAVIEQFDSEQTDLLEKNTQFKQDILELSKEEVKLSSEIEILKSEASAREVNEEKLSLIADKFAIARNVVDWKVMSAPVNNVSLLLHKKFKFSATWDPKTKQMLGRPLLQLESPGKSNDFFHDTVNLMFQASRQTINNNLACCTHRSNISDLVQAMDVLLGRITMISKEIATLRQNFNIYTEMGPSGSVKFVTSITRDGPSQIIVRFEVNSNYPFCQLTNPDDSDSVVIVLSRDDCSISPAYVHSIVQNSKGFNRISRICRLVQSELDA